MAAESDYIKDLQSRIVSTSRHPDYCPEDAEAVIASFENRHPYYQKYKPCYNTKDWRKFKEDFQQLFCFMPEDSYTDPKLSEETLEKFRTRDPVVMDWIKKHGEQHDNADGLICFMLIYWNEYPEIYAIIVKELVKINRKCVTINHLNHVKKIWQIFHCYRRAENKERKLFEATGTWFIIPVIHFERNPHAVPLMSSVSGPFDTYLREKYSEKNQRIFLEIAIAIKNAYSH